MIMINKPSMLTSTVFASEVYELNALHVYEPESEALVRTITNSLFSEKCKMSHDSVWVLT